MDKPPIRTAVLGYGLAGRVFHCPFISAVPGLHLEAIVQRTGDSAAIDYPHTRILRSPEAAFADTTLDLIVVATPNDTHESLARAALLAGKHVVVDKPLAPTTAAILSLGEAATAANRHLFPFHNRRWDGDFLTVQQLLREGTLGRLAKAVLQWDRFRPIPRDGSWKEASGDAHGILQDLGPHLLDQALTLFGLPGSLTASIRKDRTDSAIEDAFDITLHYTIPTQHRAPSTEHQPPTAEPPPTEPQTPSTEHQPATNHQPLATNHSLTVELHATMIAAEPSPRFQLHGTHGSYIKHGLDPQEAHLVAGGRHPPTLGSSIPWDLQPDHPESAQGTLTLAPNPSQPTTLTRTTLPTLPGDYRLFYAAVRDTLQATLQQNTPPPTTPTDALHVAQLIELARQSSQERGTLEVRLTTCLPLYDDFRHLPM